MVRNRPWWGRLQRKFSFDSGFKQAKSNCSFDICGEFVPNSWTGNEQKREANDVEADD